MQASLHAARRHAILCVLGSSFSFTLAAALVKAAAPYVPSMEVVAFRSIAAALVMLPLLRRVGGWGALRTKRPWGHALRLCFGFIGMITSFYGIAHLPLATNTALGFAKVGNRKAYYNGRDALVLRLPLADDFA